MARGTAAAARRSWWRGLAGLGASACSGPVSTLAPASPDAERIAGLWWVLFVGGLAVYVAVLAFGVLAIRRARKGPAPARKLVEVWIPAGTAGISAVLVVGLAVLTLVSVNALEPRPAAFTVQVISHQWWWEVRYPAHDVVTANELRLPVGQVVRLELTSPDVIHSLWVPPLHGKVDHVPGRVNTLTVEAARPGRHYGLCAEYCGLHHAHMVLAVVTEPRDAFEGWIAGQRAPARPPVAPLEQDGARTFLQLCTACHTVRGTEARGRHGPDLTHVASRESLAAGLLPNTPEHLARWIADPQALKPRVQMPTFPLPPASIQALAAYLGSLR
jgi:cytochrome c oxidase subunit II